MKKLVCMVISLMMMLSAVGALAAGVPSKTTGDMTQITFTVENQVDDGTLYLRPVEETEEEHKERLAVCNTEIEKLAQSESVEEYFGEIVNGDGEVVTLEELLGTTELDVFEFCPVIAGGFQENCGKVTAQMLFATPYEEGEQVVVLIGIVTVREDGTQTVAWTAFEGVALAADPNQPEYAGRIQVEFTEEIVHAIQNGNALQAVVSAKDLAEAASAQ